MIDYNHCVQILGALRIGREMMIAQWLEVFHHEGTFEPSAATIGSRDPRKTLLEYWAGCILQINDAALAVRKHQVELLAGAPYEGWSVQDEVIAPCFQEFLNPLEFLLKLLAPRGAKPCTILTCPRFDGFAIFQRFSDSGVLLRGWHPREKPRRR